MRRTPCLDSDPVRDFCSIASLCNLVLMTTYAFEAERTRPCQLAKQTQRLSLLELALRNPPTPCSQKREQEIRNPKARMQQR